MTALSAPEKHKYINREAQISLLRRAIDYIRLGGPIFQTIYEWTGIPGIGKTVLVELLRDLCAEMGVPHAHIDFDPDWNPNVFEYATDPVLLIKELSEQLDRHKSVELDKAITQYDSVLPLETYYRDRALDEVVRAFRGYVHELLKQDPVVFLFDTTDQAPPVVLTWLEEHIVSFLSQTGRCLFVFAGRTPLHWSRFEVRRRVHSEKLMAFEPKLVKEQLGLDREHPSLIALSDQVYHLTNGHPMGNMVIVRRLGELADEGVLVDEETFPSHERELLNDLVREVIDEYVFRGVEQGLANACRAVALLRQFDVILLRRILLEFVPAFHDFPPDAFGGLLGLLHTTHLIEWDDIRKGYNLDSTLRRILSRHMRQNNPDLYIGINQAALEVYRDWIKRVVDNRSVYIMEELYHEACIAQVARPKADWQIELTEHMQTYLDDHYTQGDPELLDSALERLDKGLERDKELEELIGGKGVNTLRQVIAAHRERLKQSVAAKEASDLAL